MGLKEVIYAVNNLFANEHEPSRREDVIVGKYFCAEERFSSSNMRVKVDNVGEINFPIDQGTVERLVTESTETQSELDRLRDIHVIPASKLTVELDEEVFTDVLGKIASQLKIGEHCKLVPHLFNMLVYNRLCFFREEVDGMVATLVMILPSVFQGGELVVEHFRSRKTFGCSPDLDTIKCVAFYSDCTHLIDPVSSGCRFVLKYNIELTGTDKPTPIDVSIVDEPLNVAIAQYFDNQQGPKHLIIFLTYLYSEESLKWYSLMGNDRIVAWAVFAVAKRQRLTPYLALADCEEIWEEHTFDMTTNTLTLYHWLDEDNQTCDRPDQLAANAFHKDACNEPGRCYVPYRKREISWGRIPAKRESWYRFSCIVLMKE